jgi:hypothetical protein
MFLICLTFFTVKLSSSPFENLTAIMSFHLFRYSIDFYDLLLVNIRIHLSTLSSIALSQTFTLLSWLKVFAIFLIIFHSICSLYLSCFAQDGKKCALICWSSVICIYALYSCFIVEWVWFKLLMAGVVFQHSVLPSYKALQAERSVRREQAQRFQLLMTSVNEDDVRLHDVCSICMMSMERLDACVTPCGHVLHVTCLKRWFDVKETCPCCRAAFVIQNEVDVYAEQMMPEGYQPPIAL